MDRSIVLADELQAPPAALRMPKLLPYSPFALPSPSSSLRPVGLNAASARDDDEGRRARMPASASASSLPALAAQAAAAAAAESSSEDDLEGLANLTNALANTNTNTNTNRFKQDTANNSDTNKNTNGLRSLLENHTEGFARDCGLDDPYFGEEGSDHSGGSLDDDECPGASRLRRPRSTKRGEDVAWTRMTFSEPPVSRRYSLQDGGVLAALPRSDGFGRLPSPRQISYAAASPISQSSPAVVRPAVAKRPSSAAAWTAFWGHEVARSSHVALEGSDALPDDNEGAAPRQYDLLNFLAVPLRLESLLFFGFFSCLDVFFELFTFQPLRVLRALVRGGGGAEVAGVRRERMSVLVLMCASAILYVSVDPSIVYHYVRGQATFKLYVIYNCLEILDRLCTYFGNDVSTLPHVGRGAMSFPALFAVQLLYVCIHAFILFLQLITLNVAINEVNLLLTLLVSNQFIELKTSVFKKYSEDNLFQIVGADAVERFQIFVYIVLIAFNNLSDRQWAPGIDWFFELGRTLVLVAGSEALIDWIKHAFIARFNAVPVGFYESLLSSYRDDLQLARGYRTPVLCQRLGFVPLPLAAVVFKVVFPSFASGAVRLCAITATVWVLLVAFKFLVFISLRALARVNRESGRDAAVSAAGADLAYFPLAK